MCPAKRTDTRVVQLLEDVHHYDASLHAVVAALRTIVLTSVADVREEVKYGGLLYSSTTLLCGIYPYKKHVTLEFSQGFALEDAYHVLEGGGKLRRHIKFHVLDDVNRKQAAAYIRQAVEKAAL